MSAARRRLPLVAAAAIALAGAACRDDGGAMLTVVVTVSGSPPRVDSLRVTLDGPAGSASKDYLHDDQSPITFPTTLTAELPERATGEITIDVQAKNAAGTIVASGQDGPRLVRKGDRLTVYVHLKCGTSACVTDGGVGPEDGSMPTSGPSCGNGRIDPGETCDKAIARGDPGACPPASCNDGLDCTTDVRVGNDCTAECKPEEIRTRGFGDGCCPALAKYEDDRDCSKNCGDRILQAGELCDTGIAAGAPGACPTADDCTAPPGSCETAMLISAGTCSAVCLRRPIVTQSDRNGDGCCPAGATNGTDIDCPIICGNGVVDSSEACDPGMPPLSAGSCPTSCDDGKPCTADFLTGTGCQVACQHDPITALISGDGCCPGNANHQTDTDCPFRCGNGVLDPGEACDKAAPRAAGGCPESCTTSPHDCLRPRMMGNADDCSARCVLEPVTECSKQEHVLPGRKGDGCCPPGCTDLDDADCSSQCGDGFIQVSLQNETCDILTPVGQFGVCPTMCSDGLACTEDRLISAGTCHATCVPIPITELRAGDGCCPMNSGGNFTLDPDCPGCGNGVVDAPIETCDYGITGSCPDTCPPPRACTHFELRGARGTCDATCVTIAITACSLTKDDCCPAGCTKLTDVDCPTICGDGAIETQETCDRAITPGMSGACEATCDDHDACTVDLASGSAAGCTRSCVHRRITACVTGDGCCPAGCPAATDKDCAAICGDSLVGGGETCDPPATCPSACPDDGNTCTIERLEGNAQSCNVTCVHAPITACSGSTADSCCPTGCRFANDTDC